jgi:plasmid stabilization system protein ParE
VHKRKPPQKHASEESERAPNYHISDRASEDMRWIAHFLADWPAIASRVLGSITEQVIQLGEWPEMGQPRDDLASGLRSFPAGSYVIL